MTRTVFRLIDRARPLDGRGAHCLHCLLSSRGAATERLHPPDLALQREAKRDVNARIYRVAQVIHAADVDNEHRLRV
jgi:hypothetical protein